MSAAEEVVVKFPIKTKLVCSDCGAPGEGSCRCGAAYVTPGERADAAVKANPEKSDRAIAEEIGTDHKVVGRARKRTGAQAPVGKRTGKDGKARKQPKPRKTRTETSTKAVEREALVATLMDQGKSTKQIASELGVGLRATNQAMEHVLVAREAIAAAKPEIDSKSLSMSAQEKLATAIRQHKRKLDADHVARLHAVDEEVRLRVIAENKDYLAMVKEMEAKVRKDQKWYHEITNDHKPLFTIDQFKAILMCLHPDGQRTPDKLAEAFRLFNAKKVQLTGAKQ